MEANTDLFFVALGVVFLLSPIVALVLALRLRKRKREIEVLKSNHEGDLQKAAERTMELEERFSSVLDPEKEAEKARSEFNKLQKSVDELRANYREKRQVYERLLKEVATFDERISFAELGVYEPHFEFDDSEAFKPAIKDVRKGKRGW